MENPSSAVRPAPSRADRASAEEARFPVAVVDIGSNSVRLVVYEALKRSPVPFFNEKAMAGLGAALGSTGRLSERAVGHALAALRRYRALADRIGVAQFHVLATAAVRDAADGASFVAAAEEICRAPIEVLSGAREAQLTALGVISGVHEPDGIAADLGGGSLELVDVRGDIMGGSVTLPLGGLRLADLAGGSLKRADRLVREALESCRLLDRAEGRAPDAEGRALDAEGRTLYAVGGTWRALGRLHMHESGYPLRVMHGYALSARRARDFAETLKGGAGALPGIEAVNEARRPLLPYGALVLEHLLRVARPKRVVFSALGVREGFLYDLLDVRERGRDALLAGVEELARFHGRSPAYGRELCAWTDALLASAGVLESPAEIRLRHAACLLSDIAWRAHPDHRAEEALQAIAYANVVGVEHKGRAYLALAAFHRYAGSDPRELWPRSLITAERAERARLVGLACRLAHVLSAGMPGVLPGTALRVRGKQLMLSLGALAALEGRRVQRRLGALAKLMKLDAAVEV